MKKLKRLILCFAFLLCFGTVKTFANPIDYNNSIGFYYLFGENLLNYGLQYQHWFTDRIGLTTEGMVYYSTSSSYSNPSFSANVNAEFDFMLFSATFSEHTGMKLYSFLEAGYLGGLDNSYNSKIGAYESTFYNNLIAAVGFTAEFDFFEHISIPLKFGFGGKLPYEASVGFVFGSGIKFLF